MPAQRSPQQAMSIGSIPLSEKVINKTLEILDYSSERYKISSTPLTSKENNPNVAHLHPLLLFKCQEEGVLKKSHHG